LLWGVAAAYLGVCAFFYWMQERMLFFPDRQVRLTPSDVGMKFEDVWLTAEDGVKLHGWVVGSDADAPWILFCHGNGGNIAGRLDVIRFLRRAGANVLMFDYRGYGQSEGAPSEKGLYLDAEAAWKHLAERGVSADRVVIFGESLGGGVATALALKHPPGGLILHSTFTCVPDVGARVYWWLPVRALCRNVFPSADRVATIACPKLILHGPDDEIIPYALGRALYEKATEPKTFVELEGFHNTGLSAQPPRVAEAVREFLQTLGR